MLLRGETIDERGRIWWSMLRNDQSVTRFFWMVLEKIGQNWTLFRNWNRTLIPDVDWNQRTISTVCFRGTGADQNTS